MRHWPAVLAAVLAFVACDPPQVYGYNCRADTREAQAAFVISCVGAARSGATQAHEDQDADDLVNACGRQAKSIHCEWGLVGEPGAAREPTPQDRALMVVDQHGVCGWLMEHDLRRSTEDRPCVPLQESRDKGERR